MKRFIYLYLLIPITLVAQKDFSENWTDLFSYNSVSAFQVDQGNVYAATDNAMFTFNNGEVNKFSTINGLSGLKTSALFYLSSLKQTYIGYETGNIDIIFENGEVKSLTGISTNTTYPLKTINSFTLDGDILYISCEFGIVKYNINSEEFEDTSVLNSATGNISILETVLLGGKIYALTAQGIFHADINENLNNFLNWTLISGAFKNLLKYKDQGFYISNNQVRTFDNNVIYTASVSVSELNLDGDNLVIRTNANKLVIYNLISNSVIEEIDISSINTSSIEVQSIVLEGEEIYVATKNTGVLIYKKSSLELIKPIVPPGPSRNDVFSVTVDQGSVWIAYGGYLYGTYNFQKFERPVSGFYNNRWFDIPFSDHGGRDVTKIIINPNNPEQIFIGSYLNGVQVFDYKKEEDDQGKIIESWNKVSQWLESTTGGALSNSSAFPGITALVSTMTIDNNNNLWMGNSIADDNKNFTRYNFENEDWDNTIDFSSIASKVDIRFGNIFVHSDGNIFVGTKNNGLVFFNENNNPILPNDQSVNKIGSLNTNANNGSLPINRVRSVVVDDRNRIWIGTSQGLVVFNDHNNLFNENKAPAEEIIFEEGGTAKILLKNISINDIIIDGAGNKWFATNGAGVFVTTEDGQVTINNYTTTNSPLPDNAVIDLELDDETGEIYMATSKGLVKFKNEIEPFSDRITDIIAYPNPAIKGNQGHDEINIVAKDGNGLPEDSNVKILDASGKLVYETNITPSQQALGGKVVWDKTNLRGQNVVSGIYIVLISSPDGSENASTKIAIVN